MVLCCGRLHMWTKFSDGWSKTATCITENVTISFKHEYRRPTLTSRCDVINDVINIKSPFWRLISGGLSISNVKMNLSQIFHGDLLNRKLYRKLSLHQDRTCHSLYFEILFDVLAEILTELWLFQILTYFLTSWPSYLTFDLEKL